MYETEQSIQEKINKLPTCSSEEEVWQLMNNVLMPGSDISLFGDSSIRLIDSAHEYVEINLNKDIFGLSIRLIYLFRMNGYLGHINYGGGQTQYLSKLKQTMDLLYNLIGCKIPKDINMLVRDMLIEYETKKGNKAKTIKPKIDCIIHWQMLSQYMPYFLTINSDIYNESPIYNDFMIKYSEQINNESDEKEIFPSHLLEPIIYEAIEYFEKYSHEILLLAAQRNDFFLDKKINTSVRTNRIVRYMRTTETLFSEPILNQLQEYCHSLRFSEWEANSDFNGLGPIKIVRNVVTKLQAVCSIIILIFSSARQQELLLQKRNLVTPKTAHHELDQTYNFMRIIWKTDRYGKLHTIPMPLIAIESYKTLSKLSECFDGKKTGYLHFSDIGLNEDKRGMQRIQFIIKNFSREINGENNPVLNPHQLRHAMASIVTLLNDADGLSLAAKMMGHKSIKNTFDYQQQLRTMIHREFQYMAEHNTEVEESFKEYEENISLKVLDKKIAPQMRENKQFFGKAAHLVSSINIVRNVEADIAVRTALIKQGKATLRDMGFAYCWHETANIERSPCQRGFDDNYDDFLPLVPAACIGSECKHSFRDEEQVEDIMHSANELVKSAPLELQERASEWLYIVNSGISETDKEMIEEYKKLLNERKLHA